MKRLAALASLLLAACGPNNIGSDAGQSDSGSGDGGQDAGNSCAQFLPPPFACPGGSLVYPSCPYGDSQGQIFDDYVLTGPGLGGGGFFDPTMATTGTPALDIPSANVSNPMGAPAYNGNMAFHMLYCAQASGFRYAMIDVSAVWCPHCNDEAAQLPSTYVPGWQAKGGIVFSILVQGSNPANPATQADLNAWIEKYGTNYPMSLDPQEQMVAALNLQAWPANIIIDLRTMKVVDAVFGATFQFYTEFDNVLNGP